MKLTDTETTVHDELDLIPFTDPKLSQVPTNFDFELESPHLLKDKLIEKMKELGGVGLSAIQIGKAMGAYVVAVARGKERCKLAQLKGANITFDNNSAALGDDLKLLEKIDVIYDPVGGNQFQAALLRYRL